MDDFSGRTVLVTGGTQGIGLGISRAFAERGATVIVVGRETAAAPGEFVAADLATADGCTKVAKFVADYGHGLDVLVNNAGVARFAPLAESSDALLQEHVALNLIAPFRLTQALMPLLLKSRGNVLCISSYFARRMVANRASSIYSMTKGGLEALTKSLAFELGAEGVRVNAIAPGTVDTPMFRRNLAILSVESRNAFDHGIKDLFPLGRIGAPDDIANAALFLCSPAASWITGVVLPVDGGLTTH